MKTRSTLRTSLMADSTPEPDVLPVRLKPDATEGPSSHRRDRMNGDMSLISRRAMLEALIANAIGAGFAGAQTRVLSKARPLSKDAVTHDWSAFLGPTHNAVSTETRLTRTTAAARHLGARQGHRLCHAGGRGGSARVPPSIAQRGDRRVPARGDRRDELALPLSDGFRGSLRVQQRPAIEPGHRRRAGLHGRRQRHNCTASIWAPGQ